jgi:hypothetical protein
MQPWEEKEQNEKWKYVRVYYDLETTQCDPVEGKPDSYEHKPNLIVSQAVSDLCLGVAQNEYFCVVCKTRQQIFHNLDNTDINVMG